MILKLKPFSFTIYNLQLYISEVYKLQVNETYIYTHNILYNTQTYGLKQDYRWALPLFICFAFAYIKQYL